MKIITKVIEFVEYEDASSLEASESDLLQQAKEAASRAYAPYSGFKVGAAILLENGAIIEGNNQENSSYPVGTCAERTALFYASSRFPGVKIKAIAIAAQTTDPIPPCGMCRQALSEYETKQEESIKIILSGNTGKVWKIFSVADLLPLQFDHHALQR